MYHDPERYWRTDESRQALTVRSLEGVEYVASPVPLRIRSADPVRQTGDVLRSIIREERRNRHAR